MCDIIEKSIKLIGKKDNRVEEKVIDFFKTQNNKKKGEKVVVRDNFVRLHHKKAEKKRRKISMCKSRCKKSATDSKCA